MVEKQSVKLAALFEVFTDENCLRIVGMLAERDRSIKELASDLRLSCEEIRQYMSYLAKADLLSRPRSIGYYRAYSLNLQAAREVMDGLG
jgi:DNA-binding transcriptional ArsR family regulator